MELSIRTTGTGAPLVLIHGWGMSSSVWALLLPVLQENFCVTVVDLPGHGESAHEGPWQMDEFVEALAQVISEDSIVLGWSLGGMLALRLAALFPERVARLILLASSAKFVRSRDWRYAQPNAVLTMFVDKLLENPSETLKRFLLLQTQGANNKTGLNKLIKRVTADDRLPKKAGLMSGLSILKSKDLRHDLRRLKCPVLQLLGEKDQLVPMGVSQDSALVQPEIQTVIIKDAAHVPFLSHPEETLRSINRFCLV